MAMKGVLRPGHIQLRVLDLEESVTFYKDVLGLVETGRDKQGRVYFKAWDERDHNSVILRQADMAGVDFFAFKVDGKASLDKFDADLRAYGLATERIAAGELLETGERVRFELPTGHKIELYAEKTDVGNGMPYLNPEAVDVGGGTRHRSARAWITACFTVPTSRRRRPSWSMCSASTLVEHVARRRQD
jgi:catechol 2,3-dioxygenase